MRAPGEFAPQACDEVGIQLDSGQPSDDIGERLCEPSRTGADLQDVVVGRDTGIANQLRGNQPAA